MRPTILGVLLFLLVAPAHAAERQFYSGYIGTVPPGAEDQAKTYFDRPEVRHLLTALENGPMSETKAASILSAGRTSLSDLERLGFVRTGDGGLRIGFPYFTAKDMALIHAVAQRYVPSLVAAYKAKSPELDASLARYGVAGVARKRLAFVLVVGFSLNWDALDLLSEKGYRQPFLISGPGWHYGFWAAEETPGYSYKGYYWGSSSFPADAMNLSPPLDFTFSSFGDPFSDPRMNFPDLLAMPPEQMTPAVAAAARALGLQDDDELGLGLKNVIGLSRARDFGAILFAMRRGARARRQICFALPAAGRNACAGELGVLVAAGYIAPAAYGRYVLKVPVFDNSDGPMLASSLALSRSVIEEWLSQNYPAIEKDLDGLAALKQGVSYPVLFSQIWHELFGLATRELVSQGVVEDPYGSGSPSPGSVPVVWRTSLFHHAWQ